MCNECPSCSALLYLKCRSLHEGLLTVGACAAYEAGTCAAPWVQGGHPFLTVRPAGHEATFSLMLKRQSDCMPAAVAKASQVVLQTCFTLSCSFSGSHLSYFQHLFPYFDQSAMLTLMPSNTCLHMRRTSRTVHATRILPAHSQESFTGRHHVAPALCPGSMGSTARAGVSQQGTGCRGTRAFGAGRHEACDRMRQLCKVLPAAQFGQHVAGEGT